MRNWLLLMMVLPACGRWGFSEPDAAEGSGDGRRGDGGIDAPTGGTTVTFGETPAANVKNVTADTFLSSEVGSTTFNYGAAPSLDCEGGQKTALLRFDLTALAAGTAVTSAQLHLSFTGTTSTVTIRPLLEAWTEGTGSGTAGVANNTARTATASWTTPGAGAPGSAGVAIATLTSVAGDNTIVVPAATVQGWIASPATNFGILIECTGDSTIASSGSATATSRPQLDVTHP